MEIPYFSFFRIGTVPSIIQMPILGTSKAILSAPPIFMDAIKVLLRGEPVRIDRKEIILVRPNFFLKNSKNKDGLLDLMINCAKEGEFAFFFLGEEEQIIPYAEKIRKKGRKEYIYFHSPGDKDALCMITRRAISREEYIYEVLPVQEETLVGLN